MVIDDDPIIVKYLVALFSDYGYETCSASNGVQVLEIVKIACPDLITSEKTIG